MAREVRGGLDFYGSLFLEGDPGTSQYVVVSQGADESPVYGIRKRTFRTTVEPVDQLEGDDWLNPDTGVLVTWVTTASGSKWVELTASGIAIEAMPADLITTVEIANASETAIRSLNPIRLYEAIEYWFGELLLSSYGAKLDTLTTAGRDFVGNYEIATGAVITETATAAIASGSRTINPQSESSLILTIPITGDFAFNLNAPQVESLRLTTYSWTGTIRFTYTSGILSFFVGTVDYTVAWEEGAPPVFETATEYIIGVTIHGPTEEIRLSVIKGIPKVTGTATITVGPTPPSSPSVNDIWFPTS